MKEGDIQNLPNSLGPKGWEIKRLAEVCENLDSKRIPITQNKRTKGDIPYYGASGVVDYVSDYIFDEDLLCVSEDGANLLARTYPIAFSISGKTWVNNHAHVLRFKNFTTQKFVEIYLNSIRIDDYVSGMAQPKLNQAMLNKLPIPLPPLPEQQRIVAILDEAFAAIARAKANAEQNLKNARELFESYLQGVFEDKGEGWEEKKFEDVCDLIGGSQPSKDDFIYEPKEGYIRLIQVRDYRTSKYITYIPKEKAKRFCSENDIMIGRYGPPIFGIFKGLEGAYNVALMKADVNTKICDSDYFFWFLKTNKLRQFVEASSKRAAGQDGIRKELLDKYPVPLPKSLKAQQAIVQKINTLSAETQKLEAIYQQKLNDLEDLKKAILQKAFSGELTDKKVGV